MPSPTVLKIAAVVLLIASISAFAFITYQPAAGSAVNWATGDNDPVLWFYPCPDGLYLVESGNVSFVNTTGYTLWERPFSGAQYSAAGADGRLYVYSRDEGLQSFGIGGDVAAIGKYDINRPLTADANGTVCFRSWTRVIAVASTGAVLWSDAVAITDPVLDRDGNVYYLVRQTARPSDTFLVSRSPAGKMRWSLLLDRYYADTSLVMADKGVYISSSMEGEFSSIDGDGNIEWTYSKPYLGQYQATADENGNMYFVYLSGTVHVLAPDGYVLSKFMLDDAYGASETGLFAAYNGTLYTAGPGLSPDSSVIYASGIDGSVLWQATVNTTGPSRIHASDGLVVVATELQRNEKVTPVLYVFDEGGRMLYSFYSGDGREWDRVTIVDGTIYARTFGGKLYSLNAA